MPAFRICYFGVVAKVLVTGVLACGLATPAFSAALSSKAWDGQFTISYESSANAGGRVALSGKLTSSVALNTGSTVCLAPHWRQAAGLQNDSPNETDYVEVLLNVPDASFETSDEQFAGLHGALESIRQVPCFELTSGSLPANTVIQFRMNQVRLPEVTTDAYEIAAYLREGSHLPFQHVPGNKLDVTPGPAERLVVNASAQANPGDEIELWVRIEDRFGNLAADRQSSLDLLVNGVYRNRVNVTASVERIEGVRFELPGIYQIELRTGGGGLRAISNPIVVDEAKEQVVWLDLGRTTSLSDGNISRERYLQANRGRFDQIITADHDEYPDIVDSTISAGFSAKWHSATGERTGSFLSLGQNPLMTVALAEKPTDFREMNAEKLRLVQVASNQSDYLWMGELAASLGYRVGFVAISHSHLYPAREKPAYTAVVIKQGQAFSEALLKGQTYVAMGERVLLREAHKNFELNGDRTLNLEVISGSTVSAITLIKNGAVLKTQRPTALDDGLFTLLVQASSEPLSSFESRPRNGREWIGYVAARDTTLETQAANEDWLIRRSNDATRLDFLTYTHGQKRQINFLLNEPTPDTVLEIGLAPVFEDAAWLPVDRLPQEIPAQRFLLSLSEIQQGARRQFEVGGYMDSVEIRPASGSGQQQTAFTFTDASRPRIGDYYYFIVALSSGAYAYTSPVFVEDGL